jgi:hypothetical protein
VTRSIPTGTLVTRHPNGKWYVGGARNASEKEHIAYGALEAVAIERLIVAAQTSHDDVVRAALSALEAHRVES